MESYSWKRYRTKKWRVTELMWSITR